MTNQNLNAILKGAKPSPIETSEFRPSGWRNRVAALIPLGLVVGFVALLAIVLGDRLVPARELTIETVVTVRAETGSTAALPAKGDPFDAPMLFQASGWIEPDPLPIKATALVDGVVDRVDVLEGASVQKGQLLATLIDDDAELNLRTAESRLAALEAQASAHFSQIDIVLAEIGTLRKKVAAARARRDELADQAKRYQDLPPGSVPEQDVAQARLQLATQEADIEALAATESEMEVRLEQLRKVCDDFKARIDEAKTDVDRMRLALDRTSIESPVNGIVLRLLAVPGQKRMLAMDDPDSATIAILYHPDKLQARIDVPLEEAAQLAVGQAVRIRSNFLPDRTFRGIVTRILGEADLQRNTLQAKVRIDDPDPRLRPEMLCRAEFLAPSSGGPRDETTGQPDRVKLFVPEAALTGVENDTAQVWLLDATGQRLEQRNVKLGGERREDHRLVTEGLKPGDRVVPDPPADLEPGQRAKPRNSP